MQRPTMCGCYAKHRLPAMNRQTRSEHSVDNSRLSNTFNDYKESAFSVDEDSNRSKKTESKKKKKNDKSRCERGIEEIEWWK